MSAPPVAVSEVVAEIVPEFTATAPAATENADVVITPPLETTKLPLLFTVTEAKVPTAVLTVFTPAEAMMTVSPATGTEKLDQPDVVVQFRALVVFQVLVDSTPA